MSADRSRHAAETAAPPAGGGASRPWQPGDAVALRYITRDGKPGMSWPYRVVEDRGDRVALFIPRGAIYKQWGRSETGDRTLVDATWRHDVLRLMFADRQHSIWLFWRRDEDGDDERRFTSYYINMEEPFRRTEIGFDTNDHVLDVVVTPDLAWQWKDAEQLDERVRAGALPAAFAAEVRAEGERAIAALERGDSPFSDGWEHWAPDPSWSTPELPAGWDTLPATLWERRLWAYGDVAR